MHWPHRRISIGVPNHQSTDQCLQGLYLAWAPRVDGTFLINEPYKQVEEGLVANIPIVTGVPFLSYLEILPIYWHEHQETSMTKEHYFQPTKLTSCRLLYYRRTWLEVLIL